jgi:hypothetical protein
VEAAAEFEADGVLVGRWQGLDHDGVWRWESD